LKIITELWLPDGVIISRTSIIGVHHSNGDLGDSRSLLVKSILKKNKDGMNINGTIILVEGSIGYAMF